MNSQMTRCVGQGLGGSWVQELLSPWSQGEPPSCTPVYSPTRMLPSVFRLLGLRYISMIKSLVTWLNSISKSRSPPCPALSPPWRSGGWKSSSPLMAWSVFLVTPILKQCRGHPESPLWHNKDTLCPSENSKGFWSSVRNWEQRLYTIYIYIILPQHPWFQR